MFNKNFYPTPINIIKKMIDPYTKDPKYRDEYHRNLDGKIILEPSAGKGNILKYQLRLGKKDEVSKEIEKIEDYKRELKNEN